MKQVKRIFTILTACLLLLSMAQAGTIAEELGVPENVALAPFETGTNKTVITIDAEVVCPQADEVYLYDVMPRVFTDAEIQTIIAGFGFPETADIQIEHDDGSGTVYPGFTALRYTVKNDGRAMYILMTINTTNLAARAFR